MVRKGSILFMVGKWKGILVVKLWKEMLDFVVIVIDIC